VAVLARTTADEALIRGFVAGEAKCAGQVSVWIAEVLRHPRLRLGPDVEDVAQQVRRKLLVSFRDARFTGASSLRTYVWRVAQHAAIDHLRTARAKPPVLPLEAVPEPTDRAASPEAGVLQEERRALFAGVLARLSDECRNLFHLIVFEELSYAQIADRLRVSEGAIKVRALRCREKAVAELKSVTSPAGHRPLKEGNE
jgi:RNA polymerase sigma factor (sigma-70 family)